MPQHIRPKNEQELANRFNQLVGNRVGRPVRPAARASSAANIQKQRTREQQGAGRQAISTYISHGGGKVSAASRKQHKAWFGSGSTEYADPYSGSKQAFEKVFDKMSQELNKQIMDQGTVQNELAAQKQTEDQNMQLGPSIEEQYFGKGITKVSSAIPNALVGLLEGGYNARDKGAGYWEETLAGLKEAGSALKGTFTDKNPTYHGAGDIYEVAKNRGDNVFADVARAAEEHAPFVEQQAARAIGAAGEYYLHPVGRAVGGATAGVIGGKLATPESIRAFADNMAERYAADVETNVITGGVKAAGNYRFQPSEAAMADNLKRTWTNVFDTAELQINSGGSKGRYRVLSPSLTAEQIGMKGSQNLLDSLTMHSKDRVQRLVDGITGRGTKLNGTALQAWAVSNPDFAEMLDDLTTDLISRKILPANASLDTVANYLSHSDVNKIRTIEQAVIDRKYTPYIQQTSDHMTREFRNNYYNTPGIRIGKKVIPIKAFGKAYAAAASDKLDEIGKNFRYNSVFPGELSLDTTRARAWGVRATEDFDKEIRDVGRFNNLTKAEDIAVKGAVENGTVHLLDPRLQAVAHWGQDQQRWMYTDEFDFGVRGRNRGKPGIDNSTTPYDPNYSYVYNKGGKQADRTKWKQDRKDTIHRNVRAGNGEGAGRFKTANAKADGYRPVEGYLESIRMRRIKHNRDMIRARFLYDTVDKYGVITHLDPSAAGYAAEKRGLVKIDFHKLPEHMRVALERTGEDAYLPKEMANLVNEFDQITKWHTGQQGQVARSFAAVMRVLKKGMTLPWPGFHMKNAIGDVFMGLLDQILPHDYARVIQKGMSALAGGEGMFKILKQNPGLDISFRDMWYKYQSEANSGFTHAELLDAKTKYNLPTRVIGRTEKIATDISGFREDAGRFTHYTTAYQQEARALWKAGERDLAKIEKKASSAALWRVNNYKFDYNALQVWEKQVKTLGFPFYTFIRKAAPTLVQALYQDPTWIAAWTRYMYQRQAGGQGSELASEFDGFRVPQDIRDIGYAFVGGKEDKPWYVTNDILPTSVFNAVNFKNPHEFFNSLISQVATPYQVGIEQGTGQQAFLDRPLPNQNIGEYLLDKLPGTREVGQLLGQGQYGNKPLAERLLSGRLGAGLPIKKLGEGQQLYARQEWQDKLIDNPLHAINYSQDIYYISQQPNPDTGTNTFAVKNNKELQPDGQATVVAEFYTAREAINYVKQNLPDNYKKIPQTMDIDNQGNPVSRPVRD